MTQSNIKRATLGTAMAAALAAAVAVSAAAPAVAQPGAVRPANDVTLSVGTGRLVSLDSSMSDLFVANEAIADVQVRSANQIYIFGKTAGETTVFATSRAGKVIYSANVRVGNNIGSIGEMLSLTMPEAQVQATPMNGMILLTGTVAAPADGAEAERLVQAFVGEGTQVISRLKTATPLQVMLQVKIAEVNRSLMKQIGVNLQAVDLTSGFQFFGSTGRDFITDDGAFVKPDGSNSFNLLGELFGVNVASAIDLNENSGLVTTLAEPTLTALSGETASFLAGGEFPIAASNGINGTSIEFKEYGVSLAFTPTVLDGGRISMRVRPEVSELTSEGAITLNGFEIPALTTRRAETTVELGSGQSFMIAGLLRNGGNNTVDKVPLLGDIPILGALFRSSNYRRNESELVIVVTPYLVKPVSANQIALPTDGFRSPNEGQRVIADQRHDSRTGEQRPVPRVGQPQVVAPGIGALGSAEPLTTAPAPVAQAGRSANPQGAASAQPGFSF
ncbi:type II and III secretion system protein family protein [Enterovirga sp. GCM10030262]|uniref:type II and III secretion system protein family protein n=1 Tax=Enterovirga sp. GCM10030262 TaxID=3273391 RepID=UPI0036141D84